MSSRRGGGKPFNSGANGERSPKGKNEHDANSSKVEQQLSHGVAGISLESAQDDGEWEVISRKSKNRAGSSSAKAWVSQNSNHKAWGHTDVPQKPGWVPGNTWQTQAADSKRPAGRGNVRSQLSTRHAQSNYVTPQPVIRPPLEHGWNWQSRAASNQPKGEEDGQEKVEVVSKVHTGEDIDADKDNDINDVDDDDDDDDDLDDSDDELLTDEFDSDSSEKSFGTRKNNKWFQKFFEIMDSLPLNDINDPARQWHCPACKGGPGAIDWYRGLQPLMTHAKTKGSLRVKLHREFAELLEEDLQRRGTSVVPAGEAFGKWKGLIDEEKDHDIVWPPMVIIMNTRLEQDENEKWIGMGNQELLDYFSSYEAAKARHSYGPQGHRGMSVLIFEASAGGYLEAERLHKHFAEQGTDRNAWDRRRSMFHPGGERQLYGYLALKEDLDIFNQHSQVGKSKLKFEMRSYHEMVVNQIKQMSEDNQQLIWLKNRNAKQEMANKALQKNFGILSEKLRKTVEENRIVRQRTKMQHEENKEEMYMQEKFFKEQIKVIHESRDAKEENFEMLQQEEREKVKQANADPSNAEEYRRRAEEIAKFIKIQEKEMEEFVLERDVLIQAHEDKMAAMRKRHWDEEVELEKEFDANLTRLMEKYTPHHPEHTAKAI
ncbi:protein SUPPRESSOR OF GENE SILENCING 3 isoform X1 [Ziziphus jujuba]|uniref:Protein SUPPRESSOR OF GENE SILENCING 3 isoform X1 n=1 Tax=Ziziphus jujuba TaxID=326968 RepID=A0ABM3IG28_ZIZJJ|nr:protein SUPPRESSOR OF GENE SILENCING 3 isoform X1 [Ziziphus jujuba]XP_048327695.1 protein SUPPRESSOR OF GENE SILENCING 3 isoform X1 [Ziziphus jujuba]XP_048327696.1 protein SUPPRESSOR OF GENE SILENCING 3 isoform X1 [Ziziphus jujuba]XP_048327697.1 protein SUPPRESSOR OF GENE SILENCING 3 isoform X1 [Ziziphus jujuba]